MQRQGLVDRALHLLALENKRFRQFSFERECRHNRSAPNPGRKNLFIGGMARAGSTALLNALYSSNQFAATTYASMPFVLAPSLGQRMSALYRDKPRSAERMHGDGIQVSAESPEALDGIFWSTYYPTESATIQPLRVPGEVLEKYAMHIENQLAIAATQRYLCKMNQSIDKLESLAGYFSESTFIIPFRAPVHQAASLLRQHHRFSGLSWYDRQYMKWQQHFEFGDLHLGYSTVTTEQKPESLNYWLLQWQSVYRYLMELAARHDNIILLCYESMAASMLPWQHLSRRLSLELVKGSYSNRNREHPAADITYDQALLDTNAELYREMTEQSEARLCSES